MTIQRKSLSPLAILALAVLGMGAKGCEPPPAPPATPPTTDPTPICQPGATCGCRHQPPGSDWITLPPCPTTPPVTACEIPDAGAVKVEPGFPSPDRLPLDPGVAKRVNDAWLALLADRPDCRDVGGRCVLGAQTDMMATLRRLVDKIREQGGCAGIQQGADEVTVLISPGRAQGVHAFVEAGQKTVGWAVPGAHRDTWSAGTPAPPATPTGCPPGTPPPGKYIVTCHVKPANPNAVFCDSTPKVVGEREYCAPDLNCPYRGGEGSAERIACERALALPVWTGADVLDDNPFSADAARGAVVKVCARDFPGACGETVAP